MCSKSLFVIRKLQTHSSHDIIAIDFFPLSLSRELMCRCASSKSKLKKNRARGIKPVNLNDKESDFAGSVVCGSVAQNKRN